MISIVPVAVTSLRGTVRSKCARNPRVNSGDAKLNVAPRSGSELAQQISDALRESVAPRGFYGGLLRDAFASERPPFASAEYGELYRERSADPKWLALSIVTNAQKEAEGANVLWKLAGEVGDPDIAREVHRHAVDESNHALYYVKLLELAFPDAADEDVERELNAISPRYSMRDVPEAAEVSDSVSVTLDEMVQMNLGEIRTRIHQQLIRPVLRRCAPKENLGKIEGVLDTLVRDETRHIGYTARFLERMADSGRANDVRALMHHRYRQFCALTRDELESSLFEGA